MTTSSAILVCDRDRLFRETLKNFLLAAGYGRVEVVATARAALALLRRERFDCMMIGLSRPFSHKRRLVMIARRRQPDAKILVLVAAADQPYIHDAGFEYVIKEQVFSNIIALLKEHEPEGEP
jgi:DNA-binding NarL/FixJ family response regulator